MCGACELTDGVYRNSQCPRTNNDGQRPTHHYRENPGYRPNESDVPEPTSSAAHPHEHGFAFYFVLRLFPSIHTGYAQQCFWELELQYLNLVGRVFFYFCSRFLCNATSKFAPWSRNVVRVIVGLYTTSIICVN